MNDRQPRPAAKAAISAIAAMLFFDLVTLGAHYLPDGAVFSALGALIRLAATSLIVLACAALCRRSGDDELPPPRELASGDSSLAVVLAALCGVTLQLASAAAVALVTSAEGFGVREAPSDTASAVRFFSAIAVAPICEETVFRGVAFRLFRRAVPTAVAVLITSAAFGLIHSGAASVAVACAAGVLLALIVWRRRSLAAAVALHAAFNLTSFFTGYIPISPAIILAVCAPLSATGIFVLLKGKRTRS